MSSTSGEPLQPSMSTTSATASSSSSQPKSSSVPATDRQIAEARRALEASMHNIGSHLDNTLRSRATDLHANNTALDLQLAKLDESTKLLAKQSDKLKKMSDDASQKLKEIGNVQNWAEVMEREFLILEETVRLADLSEPEEPKPCRVCGKDVIPQDNNYEFVLFCYTCDGEFHPACVGLEDRPRVAEWGEWHCAECQQQGTYLQNVKAASGDVAAGDVERENAVVNDGDTEMGGVETGGIDVTQNEMATQEHVPKEGRIDEVSSANYIVHDMATTPSTIST